MTDETAEINSVICFEFPLDHLTIELKLTEDDPIKCIVMDSSSSLYISPNHSISKKGIVILQGVLKVSDKILTNKKWITISIYRSINLN